MKPQEKNYSCGAAAARACLYILGHTVSEAKIRQLAKTTVSGTTADGLISVFEHFGYQAMDYEIKPYNHAWNWLKSALKRGKLAILSTYNGEHWVAAIGILGNQIIIFDPDSTTPQRVKQYSYLEIYNYTNCNKKWQAYDHINNLYTYYAIIIKR